MRDMMDGDDEREWVIGVTGSRYSLAALERDEVERDRLYPERAERVTREWAAAIRRVRSRRLDERARRRTGR